MPTNGLLIAEKPDLMRKIEQIYTKNKGKIPYTLDFVSQRGHLLTLLQPDEMDDSLKEWSWDTLPIIPENYGGWKYKVIKEKKTGNFKTSKERYDEIKSLLKSGKYDFVVHAGDPDQEGELLVNIVLRALNNKLPVKRFWTNDLTEESILASLKNLRDDSEPQLANLMDAAYCRQHTDYMIGMNTSRAATLKMDATISSGRVENVIFAIVCKREYDILNFKPKTTYGVKASYQEGFEGTLFKAAEGVEDTKEEDEENIGEEQPGTIWFDTKDEAMTLIQSLGKQATVTSYKAKRNETYAPKLFKLSTAQKAADKLGYAAADTQRIIQSLYEKEYMSYPRTGCEFVHANENFEAMLASAAVVPELAGFVSKIEAKDIQRVKHTKKWVNDKAANEEGHTALVPTTKKPDWGSLSKEEKDIYTLVARQFIAIFLPPLVQDKASLISDVAGNTFRSSGQTLVSPGFTEIFGKGFSDNQIPAHKEGDVLDVADYNVSEKTTTCPKRYTTPEIIAVCENPAKFLDDKSLKKLGKRLKIGTPATRSGIIEKLVKNKYIGTRKENKRDIVYPTTAGLAIYQNIGDCKICKVDLTGECEEQLDLVRTGQLSKKEFEKNMYTMVREFVEDLRSREMNKVTIAGQKKSQYENIGTCPKCGKTLVRGPKMFYCNGYKDGCKVGGMIEYYGAALTNEEFLDMLQNGITVVKEMERGPLKWQQKIQCDETGKITYPNASADSGYTCLCCGNRIMETDTAYACSGRKDKSCDILIYKNVGEKLIPKDQFDKLFTDGKTDVIPGFYSEKKKKHYDAFLYVDKEEKKIKMKAGIAETPTDYKCPCCGKLLLRKGFQFVCEGTHDDSCHFSMYAVMYKKDLPEGTIRKMLHMVESGEIGGRDYAYVTEGEVATEWKCPFCGGAVKRDGMHFYCENKEKKTCSLEFYRTMAHHMMDDHEILALLSAGKTPVIDDFANKKGEKFSARLELNWDSKAVEIKFENEAKTSKYACPCCGKMLTQEGLKLHCACGFTAWTYAGGKQIPARELDRLFASGSTNFLKLNGKNGSFEAKILVDKGSKSTKYMYKPKKK